MFGHVTRSQTSVGRKLPVVRRSARFLAEFDNFVDFSGLGGDLTTMALQKVGATALAKLEETRVEKVVPVPTKNVLDEDTFTEVNF